MQLNPFELKEVRQFFPHRNLTEIVEIYASVGGVPKYLEVLQTSRSLHQGLAKEAFSKNGYFFKETEFVLGEQLKKTEQYYRVLTELSKQPLGIAQLERVTHISAGQLSFYLERLQRLGFVERLVPFGSIKTTKKVRYQLKDYFLRFYFAFVAPTQRALMRKSDPPSFQTFVGKRWDSYLGKAFELICYDHAHLIAQALGFQQIQDVGTYWQKPTQRKKGVQIDLIIECDAHTLLVCECKWTGQPIGTDVHCELQKRINLFPNLKRKTIIPTLISGSGFTKDVKKENAIECVDLQVLLK